MALTPKPTRGLISPLTSLTPNSYYLFNQYHIVESATLA